MRKLPVLILYWSDSNGTNVIDVWGDKYMFLLGTTTMEKINSYSKTKHSLLVNEAHESTMNYRKISNTRRTESLNSNVSRLVL